MEGPNIDISNKQLTNKLYPSESFLISWKIYKGGCPQGIQMWLCRTVNMVGAKGNF